MSLCRHQEGRKLRRLALLAAMLAVVPSAGVAEAQEATGGAGGITGIVTDVTGASLLIEENPNEQSGSEKASVEVTDETRIFRRQGGHLTPAGLDDLEVGNQVETSFAGPVAESYPVQATAGSIIILEDTDGGELPATGGALPTLGVALAAGGLLAYGVCRR